MFLFQALCHPLNEMAHLGGPYDMLGIGQVVNLLAGQNVRPGGRQPAFGEFLLNQEARWQGYPTTDLGGADAHVEDAGVRTVIATLTISLQAGKPVVSGLRAAGILWRHQPRQSGRLVQSASRQQGWRVGRHQLFAGWTYAFGARQGAGAEEERQAVMTLA